MYKSNLSISDVPKLKVQALNSSSEEQGVCGYPCIGVDQKKNFKCGSVGYPTIKTPTRFAVYKIAEKR